MFRKVATLVCFSLAFLFCSFFWSSYQTKKAHTRPVVPILNHPLTKNSVLSLAIQDTPLTLLPYEARRASDISIIRLIYEGLLKEDPVNHSTVLQGAKKISLSEDKKQYIFFLKKTRWSNGEIVSAHDYRRSWLIAAQHSPNSYMFSCIAGYQQFTETGNPEALAIQAQDDYTLVVTLNAPNDQFLSSLTTPTFFPFYKESSYKNPSKGLVSNGPFTIHQIHSNPIILQPNYYYSLGKISLSQIQLLVVPSVYTAVRLFEKGTINWIGQPWGQGIPIEFRQSLSQQFELHQYPVKGTFWLVVNPNTPSLQSKELRRFLALSINKEDLVHHVLRGHQQPAYTMNPAPLPMSPPKLVQHLLKIQKRIFLTYPSDIPSCARLAEFLQQEWYKRLGIRVEIQGYEYRTLVDKRSKFLYDITTQTATTPYYSAPIPIPLFPDPLQSELQQMPADKREEHLINNYYVIPLYHLSYEYCLNTPLSHIVHCSDGSVDLSCVVKG